MQPEMSDGSWRTIGKTEATGPWKPFGSQIDFTEDDNEEICRECKHYVVGEPIKITSCGHRYHLRCLWGWHVTGVLFKGETPVCKAALCQVDLSGFVSAHAEVYQATLMGVQNLVETATYHVPVLGSAKASTSSFRLTLTDLPNEVFLMVAKEVLLGKSLVFDSPDDLCLKFPPKYSGRRGSKNVPLARFPKPWAMFHINRHAWDIGKSSAMSVILETTMFRFVTFKPQHATDQVMTYLSKVHHLRLRMNQLQAIGGLKRIGQLGCLRRLTVKNSIGHFGIMRMSEDEVFEALLIHLVHSKYKLLLDNQQKYSIELDLRLKDPNELAWEGCSMLISGKTIKRLNLSNRPGADAVSWHDAVTDVLEYVDNDGFGESDESDE
jgi:hypothetical protein